MLSCIMALSLAFLSPAPSTSAPPAAPAQLQASAPLREIVYKFHYYDRLSGGGQSFEDSAASATSGGGYNGTITIDIIQVDPSNGTLRANIIETTDAQNYRAPTKVTVIISPAGGVSIADGDYDEAIMDLTPYLGTGYFQDHPLQQGATWSDSATAQDSIELDTTNTVSAVNGDVATIQSTTKAARGLPNGSFEVDTKVEYKAPKLVPISVDILMTRDVSSADGYGKQTRHFRFDRVSDTRDAPGAG